MIRRNNYLEVVVICPWSESLDFNGASLCLYWSIGVGPRHVNLDNWET